MRWRHNPRWPLTESATTNGWHKRESKKNPPLCKTAGDLCDVFSGIFGKEYDFANNWIFFFGAYRDAKDLKELSDLGHFLKGSSATLGLTKVKEACEKIQHFGAKKDETGQNTESNDSVSLQKIKTTLTQAKEDYNDVVTLLKQFYGEK